MAFGFLRHKPEIKATVAVIVEDGDAAHAPLGDVMGQARRHDSSYSGHAAMLHKSERPVKQIEYYVPIIRVGRLGKNGD